MFPEWPKDVIQAKEGQTYRDPEGIPEEMRTKPVHKESADGSFHDVKVVTTLRRTYLAVYAEIVRIDFWIAEKSDGNDFYLVNLVKPHNVGFYRSQKDMVILSSSSCDCFNEISEVAKLLADANRFIQWRHHNRLDV